MIFSYKSSKKINIRDNVYLKYPLKLFLLLCCLTCLFADPKPKYNVIYKGVFDTKNWRPMMNDWSNLDITSKQAVKITNTTENDFNKPYIGIQSRPIPISEYQNRQLQLTFKLKIDEVKRWSKATDKWNYFLAYVDFQSKGKFLGLKNRVSKVYNSTCDWQTSHFKLNVPGNADSMILVFEFAKATGSATIKDISVSAPSAFSVAIKHSKSFNRCLLVPKKNSQNQPVFIQPKTKSKSSDKNFIAQNHISFDDNGIFFDVEINDKHLVQPYKKGGDMWRGDSIQMAFDTLFKRGSRPALEDYELCFSCIDGKPTIFAHKYHGEKTFDSSLIKYNFNHDGQKSTYNILIPWDTIAMPQNPEKLSYSFLVNNNDTGNKRTCYEWASGIAESKCPEEYGVLLFDHKNKKIAAELIWDTAKTTFNHDDTIKGSIYIPVLSTEPKNITCRLSLDGDFNKSEEYNYQVKQGENQLQLELPLDKFIPGKNNYLNITVTEKAENKTLLDTQLKFVIRSTAAIIAETNKRLQRIKDKLALLKKKLSKYGGPETKRPQELFVTSAIAEIFVKLIPYDLGKHAYNIALREAKDTEDILDIALSRLEKGDYTLAAEKSVSNLTFSDGIFRNQNKEPVFLFHAWADEKLTRSEWHVFHKREDKTMFAKEPEKGYRILKDLGTNLKLCWRAIPSIYFPEESLQVSKAGERATQMTMSYMREAAQYNMATYVQGTGQQAVTVPRWTWPEYMWNKYPEAILLGNHYLPGDPDHPAIQAIQRKFEAIFIDALVKENPKVRSFFLGMDVCNEPTMSTITALTEQAFQKYLKKQYQNSIKTLNQTWHTDYKSFADMKGLKPVIAQNNVAFHDWCLFNCQRFANWFKEIKKTVDTRHPGKRINLWAKFMNGALWTGRDVFNNGYDRELLSHSFEDISGGDTGVRGNSQPMRQFAGYEKPLPKRKEIYSLFWMGQTLSFDLLKSIAPNKPIFEGEWHVPEGLATAVDHSPEYLRLALRLGTWHGMNACSVWWFCAPPGRNPGMVQAASNATHPEEDLTNLPKAMEVFYHESNAINRNMDYIGAFQNAKTPLRVYYSPASVIYDGQDYLDVLKSVYEGFNFADVKTGFITERMVASQKEFPELKCIIIPNARYLDNPKALTGLKSLEENGVKIILVGHECLSKNGRDQQLKETLNLENSTIWKLQSKDWTDASVERFYQLIPETLKVSNIKREYTVVDMNGKPLRAVEARFTTLNSKPIGYIANLSPKPVTVKIVNNAGTSVSITTPENKNYKANTPITLDTYQSIYGVISN